MRSSKSSAKQQLKYLRTQKEALDHLANMDVEKARPAVPALVELYKDTHRPEHLEALARYKDERTKPILIEALDYSDDDFDRATIAAGVLGDMKATDAVDALIKAAEKQLPVKSRANNAKLAAMRALVRIGDKRATPTLMKILGTSADEQDFALNQKAALGLAELRDPASVPALIKGLFMTGRGANIFQECRLGLVRIGAPAVDPLIEALEEKNPDLQAMATALKFEETTPGVIPHKAAILLGDIRARKAAPVLISRLKAQGARRRTPLGGAGARVHRDARRRGRHLVGPQGRQGRSGRTRLRRRRSVSVGRSPRGADAARDRQVGLRDDRWAEGVGSSCQRGHRARADRWPRFIRRIQSTGRKGKGRAGCVRDGAGSNAGRQGMWRRSGMLRQEAARPVVDARREGGLHDRILGRRRPTAFRCCSAL